MRFSFFFFLKLRGTEQTKFLWCHRQVLLNLKHTDALMANTPGFGNDWHFQVKVMIYIGGTWSLTIHSPPLWALPVLRDKRLCWKQEKGRVVFHTRANKHVLMATFIVRKQKINIYGKQRSWCHPYRPVQRTAWCSTNVKKKKKLTLYTGKVHIFLIWDLA